MNFKRPTEGRKNSLGNIPDTLLIATGPGISLALFGNTLGKALTSKDWVDCRFKLLALLVILGVALAAVVPEFDLLPTACRLAQRVSALTLIAHLHNPPLRWTAAMDSLQLATSRFRSHNCVIDLTCSRLC